MLSGALNEDVDIMCLLLDHWQVVTLLYWT